LESKLAELVDNEEAAKAKKQDWEIY
jgi:hypothetical protein